VGNFVVDRADDLYRNTLCFHDRPGVVDEVFGVRKLRGWFQSAVENESRKIGKIHPNSVLDILGVPRCRCCHSDRDVGSPSVGAPDQNSIQCCIWRVSQKFRSHSPPFFGNLLIAASLGESSPVSTKLPIGFRFVEVNTMLRKLLMRNETNG